MNFAHEKCNVFYLKINEISNTEMSYLIGIVSLIKVNHKVFQKVQKQCVNT